MSPADTTMLEQHQASVTVEMPAEIDEFARHTWTAGAVSLRKNSKNTSHDIHQQQQQSHGKSVKKIGSSK